MTMPSSVVALHRRTEAVRFASQTERSTGALLSLAGVAVPGPGHPGGCPGPGWPSLLIGGHRRPKRHGEE